MRGNMLLAATANAHLRKSVEFSGEGVGTQGKANKELKEARSHLIVQVELRYGWRE